MVATSYRDSPSGNVTVCGAVYHSWYRSGYRSSISARYNPSHGPIAISVRRSSIASEADVEPAIAAASSLARESGLE